MAQYGRDGEDILIPSAFREAERLPQRAFIDFVPSITMYVAFAVCPSGVIRDFACSGRITVGFCRAVVDAYGIFQDIRFGVQGQQFHIGLQCMRGDIIVGIDECDIFSARLVQSSVARRAQSTVFRAMDDTEPSVFPYPCVTKRSASVRRTIVHEDDFVVLQVLPCYAFQAEVKVGLYTGMMMVSFMLRF